MFVFREHQTSIARVSNLISLCSKNGLRSANRTKNEYISAVKANLNFSISQNSISFNKKFSFFQLLGVTWVALTPSAGRVSETSALMHVGLFFFYYPRSVRTAVTMTTKAWSACTLLSSHYVHLLFGNNQIMKNVLEFFAKKI